MANRIIKRLKQSRNKYRIIHRDIRYIYIMILGWICLLTACEERSKEIAVVDFGKECTTDLRERLECRFIVLETNDSVLLNDIDRVCWVDNRIFVLDRRKTNAVYAFDDRGRFIAQIGSQGQGPGEYVDVTHFFVDEKARILTLADFSGTALLRYDLDTYQYISTLDIDYFVDCAPLGDDNWIWYMPIGFATPRREKFYLKTTGKGGEQTALLAPAYFTSGHTVNGSKTFHSFGGDLYAHFPFTSTVWRMRGEDLEPCYEIRFGDKRMPSAEYVDEKGRGGRDFTNELFSSGYVYSFWLYETERFLQTTYMRNKTTYFGFYDKEAKESFTYAFTDFIRATGLTGFYGVCGTYKDYFVGKISARVLLRNQVSQDELRRISKQCMEDDNPILCLFKIKKP